MGNLSRFDLNRIIKEYDATALFETGTFWGDGVAYGLESPFEKILSVEIIPEIAEKAKERFRQDKRVEIITTDSISALKEKLPALKKNVIFWLDAHFPGADAGMTAYNSHDDEGIRLPLEKELKTIFELRKGYKDFFIMDDLRIYEDGPYERGNVPPEALPRTNRNIHFIYKCFGKTHLIFKSYLDEGYILVIPRSPYRRLHFKLRNLFKSAKEDHYLK